MTTLSKTDWLASKPTWAQAAIVAELEQDECDSQTDYFATSTSRRVFLAWSKHTRDVFSETRKAAATFPETAHLGPGKDLYKATVVTTSDIITNGSAYWKGTGSHWHSDLYDDQSSGVEFATRADAEAFVAAKGAPEPIAFEGNLATFEWNIDRQSVEHREKHSMGHGYYLKRSGRYSSGWAVRKTTWFDGFSETIETPTPPAKPEAAIWNSDGTDGPVLITALTADTVIVSLNAEKAGVEIHFPSKPSEAVRNSLKTAGWRWSRFNSVWYHKDTPTARAFAATLA